MRIGRLQPAAPVVLAPMAGVTNAAFRSLARQFAPGLVYVSEMVMGQAVLGRSDRTRRMMYFAPDETPRSIQLYVTNPVVAADAVRKLVQVVGVDHIDLNFGCPAPKVTRNGGGSALPLKRNLLRQVVRAAVSNAGDVPVTMKFRIGLTDELTTFLDAGRIGADEGCAALALHARTTEQLYSGTARWSAIGELKAHVSDVPVLGNGDIWEAGDALEMMRTTGCDGVVVGRGCLGRPWLFADLVHTLTTGVPVTTVPTLGEVMEVMVRHAESLVELHASEHGVHDFRKHAGWYLTGYPVGSEVRRRFATADTLADLRALVAEQDPALEAVPGAARIKRGHTNGPRPVHLPDRYLEHLDDLVAPDEELVAVSGG